MMKSEIEEERNIPVVKDNELIQRSVYNLSAEQQKFLCYVISKIKPSDRELKHFTISAVDFSEVCGVDLKHVYRDFRAMVEKFNDSARWIKIGDDTVFFNIFSEAWYNDKNGSVTVKFHSKLTKYLIGLAERGNYTIYELWNVLSLKSKYSIRLYELMMSYFYYRGKAGGAGGRYEEYEREIDIDELKRLLSADNYTLYANFKARVLDKATDEINRYTDMKLSYTTKQTGKAHKVTAILFTLQFKKPAERSRAYFETIEKINRRTGQVPGQLSMFDMDEITA